MDLLQQIDKSRVPKHIAIIMDGNGRWAKKHGKPRVYGHQEGVESVKAVVEACSELNVQFLTLYAFSTENWSRPEQEVTALMELLVRTLKREIQSLVKNNVKIEVIGNIESLPAICYDELMDAMQQTRTNEGLVLTLALSFSGRWDIIQASRHLARDVEAGKIKPEAINQELIQRYISGGTHPDPELLIRTSGEFRISNFLLWQIAYSELYFTRELWPEFRENALYKAIIDYQSRERRFGKISEQLNTP